MLGGYHYPMQAQPLIHLGMGNQMFLFPFCTVATSKPW